MARRHLLSDFGDPDHHRDLARGEYLFRRGDETFGAFLLESGRVEMVRAQESGTELTLHRVYPGASFAEAALFSDSYHCDCRAEIAGRVAIYSRSRVLSALETDGQLALVWARRLADQVRDQRALLEVRSVAAADERILAYLDLASHRGEEVDPPSLRALAAELGLSEETVYRAVARLARDGLVDRQGARLRRA